MNWSKIIQIIIFLLCSTGYLDKKVCAQGSNFVTYGLEDGLVMSQIETIIQDPKGYLWVGTIGGLSRYDGVKFKNYLQKDGLAEDWITCAALSAEGDLFLGHWGGGVSMIDAHDSLVDLKLEQKTNFKYINDIKVSGNLVLIATEGHGLLVYNKETKTIEKSLASPAEKNIKQILIDSDKSAWICSENKLEIISLEHQRLLKSISVSGLKKAALTYTKEFWYSNDQGINKIKYNAKYDVLDQETLNTETGLPSNQVEELFYDQNGLVWIGTKDRGIIQFVPREKNSATQTTQGSIITFSKSYEQQMFHANCFAQDREGNIWVGTEMGLSKYMGDLFKVYNHLDGLSNNLVWSVLEDQKHRIWLGTSQGISILEFPSIQGTQQYHTPNIRYIGSSEGLSDLIVTALFEDSQGRIWAGTENAGVHLIQADKVSKRLSLSDGLPDVKIFSINQDRDGYIWAGTRQGAAKINPSTWEIETFGPQEGMGGEKVYHIYQDHKRDLWFGLLGGALTKYESGRFKTFGPEQGLHAKFILSITQDKEQTIWLATYGQGIAYYKDGKFHHLTTQDGLSSNSTHFVSSDIRGNIWVGQSLGIEKYNPAQKRFSLYGKMQGFNGIETNENACFKDHLGNIWFGTLKGGVKFDPGKDKINTIEPLTYLESIKIFYQQQALTQNASFSYKDNYLTFDVIGISLTNPKEVHYKYWLEGFNASWSPPTKQNSITFSGLPDGSYTLHVKSINNSGIESTQEVLYSFTIQPPFWKTWWFYTLCALMALAAVYIYIRQREKKLRERQIYLELEVEKRTQELKKEKEVVELQNREIFQKNKNITESISYAKRIQQAILPPHDWIKKVLPEFFILYQPKDIVSGDFYWVHETNDHVLFAAVDCTGHGVPGAFMSIIGNNLLDKIVKEMRIIKPSEILKNLSHELVKTLRQEESSEVKDGMDIAICCLHKKSNTIEFSGAYNPLYLVRKNEIVELKSDKIPVGKGQKLNPTGEYTNHSYLLEKGDMIYLFSDGYADQKGGPDKKKFYYPPFRKLLTEISALSTSEQKAQLEQKMHAWRGSTEQYDDVLIFGVKYN